MQPFSRSRLFKRLPFYGTLRTTAQRLGFSGPPERHWARIVMQHVTERWVSALPTKDFDALEISGTLWGTRNLFRSYKSVHFPEYDLCMDPLDGRFDFIVAEQVFGHLRQPYRAAENIYTMLNSGGYFLITTALLIRIDDCPVDCTRWTEVGLSNFLGECGFVLETIKTGSWGNRSCVTTNFRKWALFKPWLHSLKNDPRYPIVVWALARK